MALRSMLFVPGDSAKKLAKASGVAADALILDLEDSVTAARKPIARDLVHEFLHARPAELRAQLWVRINPLDTPLALEDLAAIMAGAPQGIVLPKAASPRDVERLSAHLDEFEARSGLTPYSTGILPITTETAAAPFTLGEYATLRLPRLIGLTWGAEDLAAALGASVPRDAHGEFSFTYRMVRSLCLLAAKAACVAAIDTLYADFKDSQGLAAHCRVARQEGFTGRLAIHPDQVEIINVAFKPTAEEIEFAQRVIAAFAAQPEAGAVSLDGKMLDRPHLRQAQSLLNLT